MSLINSKHDIFCSLCFYITDSAVSRIQLSQDKGKLAMVRQYYNLFFYFF